MKENIYEGPEEGAYRPGCFIHMMASVLGYSCSEGTIGGEYQTWHPGDGLEGLITYNAGPHPGDVQVVVQVYMKDPEVFSVVKERILDRANNLSEWWFTD